jgi:hypothetical protein
VAYYHEALEKEDERGEKDIGGGHVADMGGHASGSVPGKVEMRSSVTGLMGRGFFWSRHLGFFVRLDASHRAAGIIGARAKEKQS